MFPRNKFRFPGSHFFFARNIDMETETCFQETRFRFHLSLFARNIDMETETCFQETHFRFHLSLLFVCDKFTLNLWRVWLFGQQRNHKLFRWCFIRCRGPDLLCNLDVSSKAYSSVVILGPRGRVLLVEAPT